MNDTLVRDAVRLHVTTDEPPLGVTSAAVLGAARRSRRIRTAALSGGLVLAAVATGGVTALAGIGQPIGGEADGAAAPGPAVCAELRSTPPPSNIGRAEARDRLSCHLLTTLPALLPTATFTEVHPWQEALVAETSEQGVSAEATVFDPAGGGSLTVMVDSTAPRAARAYAGPCNATCRTGPGGELIDVRTHRDGNGVVTNSAWVYTGRTIVGAVSRNVPESPYRVFPNRPTPPLTVDQLADLASAPELVLYP